MPSRASARANSSPIPADAPVTSAHSPYFCRYPRPFSAIAIPPHEFSSARSVLPSPEGEGPGERFRLALSD